MERWEAESITNDLEEDNRLTSNDGSNFHSEVLELLHGVIWEIRGNCKSEMI